MIYLMSDTLQPSPLNEKIAEILRERIAKYRLTQASIARVAGLSQSYMSSVLGGTKPLNVDQLEAVCYSLGLEIDEVLEKAVREVRDEGWTPDVPDFSVRGNVETANMATKRSTKKKDSPSAD